MHVEGVAAGRRHRADEVTHEIIGFLAPQSDAMLDRDRQRAGIAHGAHAVRDQRRLGHQAGTEGATLHAFARATDIQIDLVVAPFRHQLRATREIVRFAAAELRGHRVLERVEIQMARDIAVQQGARGDHLGVEACGGRDMAQIDAAMPVGPVHHRCHAEPMSVVFGGIF